MCGRDLNSCKHNEQRTPSRPMRIGPLPLYQICLQIIIIQANLTQLTNSSPSNHIVIDSTTTSTASPIESSRNSRLDSSIYPPTPIDNDRNPPSASQQTTNVKRAFVIDLLKMLHEQYAGQTAKTTAKPLSDTSRPAIENRQSTALLNNGLVSQLIEAIGADGDVRRLIDWIRNSFNLASVGEVTTQFVVSKLGSVNCAALLQPDKEETLIPRFLLFNEHFVDVPFELSINPSANECFLDGKFDPQRKTMLLIHGYLAGYTLVDGITNIKNRLLDLNKYSKERAMDAFLKASQNNGSYVLTDDLQLKVKQQLYNVIIVDWFNGANPVPRSNYIRAAVNAQVVGRLIARFLSALIVQCGTPASNLQIIAHSLGCHVSGFTGKALNQAGHRLGKITHLDPVGLCFGRLFSQPQFRLRPNDALETQAVHVSLNIFDNPLDGVHSNFLVNGGRDQIGCDGVSELKNSTTSSVALLFDPGAKFAPCSHLRAVALFEEDLSSGESTGQCQMVGYRCPNYERFLAGKCGFCDSTNSQCRLMSLPPLSMQFRKLRLESGADLNSNQYGSPSNHLPPRLAASVDSGAHESQASAAGEYNLELLNQNKTKLHYSFGGAGETIGSYDEEMHGYKPLAPHMFGAPSNYFFPTAQQRQLDNNELQRRSDRRLDQQGKRLVQVIGKLRQDTRTALAGGWTNLRTMREHQKTYILGGDNDYRNPSELVAHLAPDEQFRETTTTASLPGEGPRTATSQTVSATKQIEDPSNRQHEDLMDQVPVGGQPTPEGSLNGPLFFLGTSSVGPFCVNYYQFRVLIAESRLQRVLRNQGLASNRLLPPVSHQSLTGSAISWQQRMSQSGARELLHLTVKLVDTSDHFFKGFSMVENAKTVTRVSNDINHSTPPLPTPFAPVAASEPMAELTMLLNTTRAEPVKIGETIISYYFHSIVLADRVEINYMSNISPETRAKYSSVLCPVAINDRHQLVRYVECHKV